MQLLPLFDTAMRSIGSGRFQPAESPLTFESDQGFRPDLGRASLGGPSWRRPFRLFGCPRSAPCAGQRAERPQKHVWRARIVLLTAEGVGTRAIMRETSKSKTCVWRWQERFADEALKGCCATRRGLRASRSLIRCRRTRRDADDGAAAGRSHAL